MKLKTAFALLVATMAIDSRFDVVASSSSSILDGSDPQATRKTRRVLNEKNKQTCQKEQTTIAVLMTETETCKSSLKDGVKTIVELEREVNGLMTDIETLTSSPNDPGGVPGGPPLKYRGGPTIGNYLEGGLILQLDKNDANWGPYAIGNQGTGNVPHKNDCTEGYSVWNIFDDEKKYYGTITLGSVCDAVWFKGYTHESYPNPKVEPFSQTSPNKYYIQFNGKPKMPDGPFPNVPPATPAVHTGTTNPIHLSVEENNIMMTTRGGVRTIPIRLKGLARESLEWNAQGQNLSPADIALMNSWDINVIRLDMNQKFWLASDSATSTGSYKQIINAIIHECISHNMAIILDLHCTLDPNPPGPMADKKSIVFWKDVATTYKSFGTVMFELYNEPYGITKDVWLKGDKDHAGMQDMYDAVRGVGAQNIVIVGGLGWGYSLDFVNANFEVKGTNVVYNCHPYNTKGVVENEGQPLFARNFAGIVGRHPIMFTEFGSNQEANFPPSSNNWKVVYDTYLKYINDNGIHYTAFTWFAGESSVAWDPALISNWDGTPQFGGVKVKEDLEANPGTHFHDH